MITRPSTAQLIRTVRRELLDTVVPGVSDEKLRVSIEMMAQVLLTAANRSEFELAWMREEAAAIERTAEVVLDAHPGAGAAAAALDAYRRQRRDSYRYDDVQADYDRAGEVLSSLAETVLRAGDSPVRQVVEDLMAQRLDHEVEIMGGEFRAVGRT
jgi:hypothetical protein